MCIFWFKMKFLFCLLFGVCLYYGFKLIDMDWMCFFFMLDFSKNWMIDVNWLVICWFNLLIIGLCFFSIILIVKVLGIMLIVFWLDILINLWCLWVLVVKILVESLIFMINVYNMLKCMIYFFVKWVCSMIIVILMVFEYILIEV